jgi:ribosomal protein L34
MVMDDKNLEITMKSKTNLWLLLISLFFTSSVYALPPYLGISIGENLSFRKNSCPQIATTVLQEDGFQKIIVAKNSATVFAAYRTKLPYQYKALIKCLPEKGIVIVVVVANSTQYVRTKADKLRLQIQRYTRKSVNLKTKIRPIKATTPPYFGISVGENLSFTNSSCQPAAQLVLKRAGFQKRMSSKSGMTVFAAYSKRSPYRYKALVRCLSESGVIVVIVVADSLKQIKVMAARLQQQIQQRLDSKPSPNESKDCCECEAKVDNDKANNDLDSPKNPQPDKQIKPDKAKINPKKVPVEEEAINGDNSQLTSEVWESTLLSQSICLKKAQAAVKTAGFNQDFEVSERSAQGKNSNNYIGLIRCVTTEEFVFFWVKGADLTTRKQLLNKLQRLF